MIDYMSLKYLIKGYFLVECIIYWRSKYYGEGSSCAITNFALIDCSFIVITVIRKLKNIRNQQHL